MPEELNQDLIDNSLPVQHISQVVDKAIAEVEAERSGEQHGLYSRFSKINRAMGKYFRFNHVSMFSSMTGHGKSFLLNMLSDDFTDLENTFNKDGMLVRRALNRDFADKTLYVHFNLEMSSTDEVLRNLSGKAGFSYSYILSSQWNYEKQEFNRVTDEELQRIKNFTKYLRDRKYFFVETVGNIPQIYNTVYKIQTRYPDYKIVVAIDHTLLLKRDGSNSDADFTAKIAYLALALRKDFGCMVILLHQMNNNIEKPERKNKPSLHYPMLSDIYWGSQINWVCDNVWIAPYRPELLNIARFGGEDHDTNILVPDDGSKGIPTKDLVVASCLKSRKGLIGDVYLVNNLAKGAFYEI